MTGLSITSSPNRLKYRSSTKAMLRECSRMGRGSGAVQASRSVGPATRLGLHRHSGTVFGDQGTPDERTAALTWPGLPGARGHASGRVDPVGLVPPPARWLTPTPEGLFDECP